ncbi:hypothetical protein PTKIN_Ptkin03bG0115800 [Pterospermum kingtungense]
MVHVVLCDGNTWILKKVVCPHTYEWGFSRNGPQQLQSRVIGAYFAHEFLREGSSLQPNAMIYHLKHNHEMEITYPEVESDFKIHVVKLDERKCLCRRFELDLMSCSHAAATAIRKANKSIFEYIAHYCKIDIVRQMYSDSIMPVPHPKEWDVPNEVHSFVVLPPPKVRQAG